MLNRVHLNGLRAVETVARLGSLAAAAGELNVSVSAVSQQIKPHRKAARPGAVRAHGKRSRADRIRRRLRDPPRRRISRACPGGGAGRRGDPMHVGGFGGAGLRLEMAAAAGCRVTSTAIPMCCCASTPRCGSPISTVPTSTSPSGLATANGRAGARNCCWRRKSFPVCAPGHRQETEVDRGPCPDLRHHRRAGDDQLGQLVRGGRCRARHLPERRALHRSDAVPGIGDCRPWRDAGLAVADGRCAGRRTAGGAVRHPRPERARLLAGDLVGQGGKPQGPGLQGLDQGRDRGDDGAVRIAATARPEPARSRWKGPRRRSM